MTILSRRLHKKYKTTQGTHPALPLETTTHLEPLRGLRVLGLLDEQNLSLSARDHGYRIPYDLLAQRINGVARTTRLHVFIAADPNNPGRTEYFERHRYVTHVKVIRRRLLRSGGLQCDANVDNLFAFWTGVSAITARRHVILIASGDYGLAGELSHAIRHLPGGCRPPVMTLSLPGSTAQDLDAARNPDIAANLEIGLDLLIPLTNPSTHVPPPSVHRDGRL